MDSCKFHMNIQVLSDNNADGCGFESHPRQPIFLTVSGELCCVALPFCCVVVVALPFSASLGVIVHVHHFVN